MAIGEEKSGTIASEVSTGTTHGDGTRDSKDSDWTELTVPDDYGINKDKTQVSVEVEMGSEHDYEIQYDNYVEVIPGTGVKLPQTIRAKTHARSSKGFFAGKGAERIKVKFYYVRFK